MPFELVAALVGFLFLFVFLIIVILIRGRGDILRIWVPPVPYFKGIRHNKPIRVRIMTGIGQTLSKDLVKIIDETIFKSNPSTKNPSPEVVEKREDVPESLAEAWKRIRAEPDKYTLRIFYFNRRWRTPDGVKGRWVYVCSLFSLEEMMLHYGRHKLIIGSFLKQPLRVKHPPTKEEWMIACKDRDVAKGVRIDKRRVKAYEKSYKRVSKEKWLVIVFHPTVTATYQAEVMERLEGFENLVGVTAHALNMLGSKLAKVTALEHYVIGREEYERQLRKAEHETSDRVGHTERLLAQSIRAYKEKSTPTHVSSEHAPFPQLEVHPPAPPAKSRWKTPISHETVLQWALLGLGIFFSLFGALTYMNDPSSWGILLLGVVFFFMGVVFWRKFGGGSVPAVVKEKVEEAKEAVANE